jgi:hypothetical protein
MPRNLIIAYAVTWCIHGVYLLWLWRKWKRD